MKKLNTDEIKHFADMLSFTESEAKDITNIFYQLKIEKPTNNWRIKSSLNSVDEYILEFENYWCRDRSFTEYYKYAKENEFNEYGYETAKQIFASEEAFRKYSMEKETQFVYQMPNNKMVIIVC